MASTYDHRVWKTGLPVRSAVLKPHAGRLVVGWVTTSESRRLYVFMRAKRASIEREGIYIYVFVSEVLFCTSTGIRIRQETEADIGQHLSLEFGGKNPTLLFDDFKVQRKDDYAGMNEEWNRIWQQYRFRLFADTFEL